MSSCFFSSRLRMRISPTPWLRKRRRTALPNEPVPPVMSSFAPPNLVVSDWILSVCGVRPPGLFGRRPGEVLPKAIPQAHLRDAAERLRRRRDIGQAVLHVARAVVAELDRDTT